MELADDVVVMSQGRIEQIGSADDLYDAPASPFVFSFIGESSALPAMIREGWVTVDGQQLGPGASALHEGPTMLHFRPHDAVLAKGDEPAIAATLVSVRRHGAMRRLELFVGSDRNRVEIDAPPDLPLFPGATVLFRPTRWRLYPAVAA